MAPASPSSQDRKSEPTTACSNSDTPPRGSRVRDHSHLRLPLLRPLSRSRGLGWVVGQDDNGQGSVRGADGDGAAVRGDDPGVRVGAVVAHLHAGAVLRHQPLRRHLRRAAALLPLPLRQRPLRHGPPLPRRRHPPETPRPGGARRLVPPALPLLRRRRRAAAGLVHHALLRDHPPQHPRHGHPAADRHVRALRGVPHGAGHRAPVHHLVHAAALPLRVPRRHDPHRRPVPGHRRGHRVGACGPRRGVAGGRPGRDGGRGGGGRQAPRHRPPLVRVAEVATDGGDAAAVEPDGRGDLLGELVAAGIQLQPRRLPSHGRRRAAPVVGRRRPPRLELRRGVLDPLVPGPDAAAVQLRRASLGLGEIVEAGGGRAHQPRRQGAAHVRVGLGRLPRVGGQRPAGVRRRRREGDPHGRPRRPAAQQHRHRRQSGKNDGAAAVSATATEGEAIRSSSGKTVEDAAAGGGAPPEADVLTKLGSGSSTAELRVKDLELGGGYADAAGAAQQMPPAGVMTRLILIMVWRKLIRNPNTYSSIIGLTWSLIAFRWHITMPAIVAKSISILSDAGLGMAMFSLGLFMALQPNLIACGWRATGVSMGVRFLAGPAVMAAASLAIGLRGSLLKVAIVQAALPQGIVPFVFAKEYNVHPTILSTLVIFGMLVALPITLIYYAAL